VKLTERKLRKIVRNALIKEMRPAGSRMTGPSGTEEEANLIDWHQKRLARFEKGSGSLRAQHIDFDEIHNEYLEWVNYRNEKFGEHSYDKQEEYFKNNDSLNYSKYKDAAMSYYNALATADQDAADEYWDDICLHQGCPWFPEKGTEITFFSDAAKLVTDIVTYPFELAGDLISDFFIMLSPQVKDDPKNNHLVIPKYDMGHKQLKPHQKKAHERLGANAKIAGIDIILTLSTGGILKLAGPTLKKLLPKLKKDPVLAEEVYIQVKKKSPEQAKILQEVYNKNNIKRKKSKIKKGAGNKPLGRKSLPKEWQDEINNVPRQPQRSQWFRRQPNGNVDWNKVKTDFAKRSEKHKKEFYNSLPKDKITGSVDFKALAGKIPDLPNGQPDWTAIHILHRKANHVNLKFARDLPEVPGLPTNKTIRIGDVIDGDDQSLKSLTREPYRSTQPMRKTKQFPGMEKKLGLDFKKKKN